MGAERTATFAEHIQELRRRVMWSLLFVALGAGIGYALHDTLLGILQRPLNDTLYYTNPTGAFSFVIKVCTVFGILTALPMVLFQGFGFFEPLIAVRTRRMLVWYVVVSVVLAAMGVTFAYFVSLPAALHFLVNFGGTGIESLITANEYFNFVFAYIVGFAVLFQLPLIVTFINRIKPLTPRKLMGGTRYVVVGSFIIAAVITPTPDPFNQLLMAGPIILLYFVSASMVAIRNHTAARKLRRTPTVAPAVHPEPVPAPAPRPALLPAPPPAPRASRPIPAAFPAQQRRLVSDIVVPGRNVTVPAYQKRQAQPEPGATDTHPRPRVRLISDFIPATE